ncbi:MULTISPECIES: DUF4395 domain-containing protein [Lactococcus]|uniref:DUF4395 domain-containing protein n=1 Tax=Lactococcus TaxID=1357 RepID=UPI001CDCC2E9|nr:DUF4395 domain-containing protein [Lactococcus sp. SK2-659]MCA2381734.1 DUF4395 domain-containing protein [Lactococcus sp. SK2-659]
MAKYTFQGIPRPLVRTNQTFIVLSVILAVITHFYWILLLPILAGLSGILFEKNFIILIAKSFLKKKASEYVLEDKSDLRFNQIIATALLSASLISSITNHPILAIIFAAFVFLTASIALSGFCIGCWIHFQLRQYKYRRQVKKGLH